MILISFTIGFNQSRSCLEEIPSLGINMGIGTETAGYGEAPTRVCLKNKNLR